MTSTVRPIPWDTFLDAWPLTVVPLAISIVFYAKNPAGPPFRLLGSIRGVLLAAAFSYSVIAGAFTWDPGLPRAISSGILLPFMLLLLGSMASVVTSFFVFRGSKSYFLIHVVTILLAFSIWLVGGMQISHMSL